MAFIPVGASVGFSEARLSQTNTGPNPNTPYIQALKRQVDQAWSALQQAQKERDKAFKWWSDTFKPGPNSPPGRALSAATAKLDAARKQYNDLRARLNAALGGTPTVTVPTKKGPPPKLNLPIMSVPMSVPTLNQSIPAVSYAPRVEAEDTGGGVAVPMGPEPAPSKLPLIIGIAAGGALLLWFMHRKKTTP